MTACSNGVAGANPRGWTAMTTGNGGSHAVTPTSAMPTLAPAPSPAPPPRSAFACVVTVFTTDAHQPRAIMLLS
jgi:hypothetical protein